MAWIQFLQPDHYKLITNVKTLNFMDAKLNGLTVCVLRSCTASDGQKNCGGFAKYLYACSKDVYKTMS